ncbi:MAG: NAD(P)H-hydrate epimerase, partial [Bacteroidota bacterium]
MQTVVSSSDMRWCDATTIRAFGVPGLLLMDRAGTSAAHVLLSRFAPLADRPVTIVCGGGNNAGDGFVVARVLANHGARVTVVLCAPPGRLRGDAAAHFALLRREVRSLGKCLTITSPLKNRSRSAVPPALVVDALFGTGFTGTPRGAHAAAIAWMNAARAPVASLDIPSGIDATTGCAAGEAVHASTTVTFGLLKTGLLLNEGRDHAGHVVCVDIGIPRAVTNDKRLRSRLVERQDVESLLPARPHRLHKYSAGKVLIIAGSRGYTGAASLATLGALRSGAGAVVLAHPEAVHAVLARKLTEPILVPLPSTSDGTFSPDVADALADRFEWADAVVIGPGLGRTQATAELLMRVLERYRGPTVIDADALSMLAELNSRRRVGRDWILTPHAGEFARLAQTKAEDAENDRVGS